MQLYLYKKMTKNSEARCSIINKVAKAFSLLSYCDKTTIIDKNTTAAAIPVLCKLKPEIVRLLPKYNTKRVRNGIKTHKDALVALREIIRLQNKRLLSMPVYKWDTEKKTMVYKGSSYRIL